MLTREALESLTRDEPATAAHLMAAIAQRLAERLRQSDDKINLYSHLVRTMQQEIDALMRGGHDPVKIYAAYAAAVAHRGQPQGTG